MRNTWQSKVAALLVSVVGLFGFGSAVAQDYTFGWNPRSGDVWVDTWLGDMNRYGSRYRDPFVDEMVRYHGAPRDLVTDLLGNRHWAPGDVYFACALASVLGRPCRYVVDVWERDHAQGWGAVAKNLGIKPGSPEFHRLKKGFVPSYDRWGRNITLDSDLQRDFPGRGKGPQGKPASKGGPDKAQGAGNAKPKAASSAQGKPASQGKPQGTSQKGQGQGKGQSQGQSGKGNDKGNGNGNGK